MQELMRNKKQPRRRREMRRVRRERRSARDAKRLGLCPLNPFEAEILAGVEAWQERQERIAGS